MFWSGVAWAWAWHGMPMWWILGGCASRPRLGLVAGAACSAVPLALVNVSPHESPQEQVRVLVAGGWVGAGLVVASDVISQGGLHGCSMWPGRL